MCNYFRKWRKSCFDSSSIIYRRFQFVDKCAPVFQQPKVVLFVVGNGFIHNAFCSLNSVFTKVIALSVSGACVGVFKIPYLCKELKLSPFLSHGLSDMACYSRGSLGLALLHSWYVLLYSLPPQFAVPCPAKSGEVMC